MAIDFSLTEEERILVDAVAEFGKKEIYPNLRKFESEGVSEELIRKVFELGVYSVEFSESIGGAGLGIFHRALVTEELAASGDPGITYSIFSHLPYSYLLNCISDEEKKEKYLKPVLTLEKKGILARCQIFDDLVETKVNFKRKNGELLLSGRAVIESEKPDFILIFANSDLENKTGLFVVESKDVNFQRKLMRCGVCSSQAFEIKINSSVKEDKVLSLDVLSSDKTKFMKALSMMRLYTASLITGLSRICSEYSLKYSLDRIAFGQPIAYHQAISFMLSDTAIATETARLALWKGCYLFDKKGEDDEVFDAVSEAFLEAIEVGYKTSSDALQILGGQGYIKDHPVEKWMRDYREIANFLGSPDLVVGNLRNI